MININSKYIGIMIIVLGIILLFIIVPLSLKLADIGMSQCVHENEACSVVGHVPLESYAGIAFVVALIILGGFLTLKTRTSERFTKEMAQKIKESEKKLKGDEKIIYQIVAENSGAMFQSEIVEKSGFGKAKVTRVLDKLETKGLIERRRRGMTNMILLKGK